MLYVSGTTEILIGADAARVLPRSNLAVRITVTAARYVAKALPFRGVPGEMSPYNPALRFLASEKQNKAPQESQLSQATLLAQTKLTPTISRFKFALSNATSSLAGQYVTMDFSSRLDIGYSHMRDDNPQSINDDFVRTFTVSSPPGQPPTPHRKLKDDEFEITVRKVGSITGELFKHNGTEHGDRLPLEVGVKGFGGDFEVKPDSEGKRIVFVAAGVGITPLLGVLTSLDTSNLDLFWAIRIEDIGLVADVLDSCPSLAPNMKLSITNAHPQILQNIDLKEATIIGRRLQQEDFEAVQERRIYVCTGTPLRKQLVDWLPDKELVFEDFNF
jgi:NAD(P)H-flavin reductase